MHVPPLPLFFPPSPSSPSPSLLPSLSLFPLSFPSSLLQLRPGEVRAVGLARDYVCSCMTILEWVFACHFPNTRTCSLSLIFWGQWRTQRATMVKKVKLSHIHIHTLIKLETIYILHLRDTACILSSLDPSLLLRKWVGLARLILHL